MTATEWLALQLYEKMEMKGDGKVFDEILEQAKEMEKQMFIDIVEKSRATGLTAEYLLLTYESKETREEALQFLTTQAQEMGLYDTSSQTEISDEEIKKGIKKDWHYTNYQDRHWMVSGAIWYREQIKSR